MNASKMMIAALLISGMTMSAKETLQVKNSDSESSSSIFKRKHQPRNILKLNNSAFQSSSARDWEEAEVTGGGLFVNIGLHFPSSKFLNPDYQSGDPKYGLGFDVEVGHYFRFAKLADEKVGIGLRATWLSLSYTSMSIGGNKFRAAQVSPLRVGPQVGIAINETMGVDVFYQIGFNLTEQFGSIEVPGNTKKIGTSNTFIGASHEIGAAFHYKVFSIGLGYRFGKLKNVLNYYDGEKYDSVSGKYPVNNFRITLGFKF